MAAAILAMHTIASAHGGGGGCCTMSGSFLGIMPQLHKNFIGLRYNVRSYTMPAMNMQHGNHVMHTPETTDRFTSLELWGRFYPTPRIQILTTLPYITNQTSAAGKSVQANGIGDATVMASYVVAATPDSALCRTKHRLQLGGGVKLPTGNYRKIQETAIVTPTNFSPGTGTVDFLATMQYTMRVNQLGINTDFVYKFNNENKDGYRFGNQYSGSGQVFYWYKKPKFSVLPSAGIYYEKAMPNQHNGYELAKANGSTTFSTCGMDVYYKNFAIGGNWQRPFERQHGEAGSIKNDRLMANFTVMF